MQALFGNFHNGRSIDSFRYVNGPTFTRHVNIMKRIHESIRMTPNDPFFSPLHISEAQIYGIGVNFPSFEGWVRPSNESFDFV